VKHYEFHPIAARYPLLEGDEFERLKDSIAATGVRVPGVLFAGRILDGRNRYRACIALGIEFPTTTFEGSEEAAAVYSDVLNLHRRHLSREQVREVIAFKLRAEPQRSDRDIANEVKVSPTTVGAVRKEVVASGVQVGHLTEAPRKGRDGKTYTVPKAKPAKVEQHDDESPVEAKPAGKVSFFAEQLAEMMDQFGDEFVNRTTISEARLREIAAGATPTTDEVLLIVSAADDPVCVWITPERAEQQRKATTWCSDECAERAAEFFRSSLGEPELQSLLTWANGSGAGNPPVIPNTLFPDAERSYELAARWLMMIPTSHPERADCIRTFAECARMFLGQRAAIAAPPLTAEQAENVRKAKTVPKAKAKSAKKDVGQPKVNRAMQRCQEAAFFFRRTAPSREALKLLVDWLKGQQAKYGKYADIPSPPNGMSRDAARDFSCASRTLLRVPQRHSRRDEAIAAFEREVNSIIERAEARAAS